MSEQRNNSFGLVSLPNGWTVGRFSALDALDNVTHFISTRQGLDVARVRDDRAAAAAAVAEAAGLSGVAFCHQVHGKTVLTVDTGGLAGEADALVTDETGLGLMAFSADCPLVIVVEPFAGVVGVAHASWRGTVQRITNELVLAMVSRYGVRPEELVACICPSAGPCCYEVGHEVVKHARVGIGSHAEEFFETRDGKIYLDLWAANCHQLLQMGVPRHRIHSAGICTLCRNDLFPSYRKEGEHAGRFFALVARK